VFRPLRTNPQAGSLLSLTSKRVPLVSRKILSRASRPSSASPSFSPIARITRLFASLLFAHGAASHMHLGGLLKAGMLGVWIFMLVKASQEQLFSLPIIGELAERSVAEQK